MSCKPEKKSWKEGIVMRWCFYTEKSIIMCLWLFLLLLWWNIFTCTFFRSFLCWLSLSRYHSYYSNHDYTTESKICWCGLWMCKYIKQRKQKVQSKSREFLIMVMRMMMMVGAWKRGKTSTLLCKAIITTSVSTAQLLWFSLFLMHHFIL